MSTQNRISEATEDARDEAASAYACVQQEASQLVEKHPLSTTLALFGMGLGIGVLIGCAIGGDDRRSRTAMSLGQRMLDSIQGYVPDSLRR